MKKQSHARDFSAVTENILPISPQQDSAGNLKLATMIVLY